MLTFVASFPSGVGRGGVIYLYDISSDRYQSMASVNLTILGKSLGRTMNAYRRITLATTKWNRINDEQGSLRQATLGSRWQQLISGGSKMYQFRNQLDDAWRIINEFLDTLEGESEFNIGRELALIQGSSLRNTGVKNKVMSRLDRLLGVLLGARA